MANPYEPPNGIPKPQGFKPAFAISPLALTLFSVVAALVVGMLLPLLSPVHETRSYTLIVTLQPKVHLGHAIPRFALCETRDEAMKLEQFSADPETEAKSFDADPESVIARSKMIGKSTFRLDVYAGTTPTGMFTQDDYDPRWFVVQYETADGAVHRKAVAMVDRPRTMRVALP